MDTPPAEPSATAAPRIFLYEAQSPHGHALSGTIDAASHEDAREALSTSGLRVVELGEAAEPRRRPLRGDDFFAFNQQLAQLTDAGLPVESGLRLIADDMRRGRLAASVRAVAEALEGGASLPEAFGRHRALFPPLYGRLVEAGIRSHRLSGVLLNLGRHLEMMQRLRAALWRAGAYPLVVFVVFVAVLGFISVTIVPQFEEIFEDFGTQLPYLTELAVSLSRFALPMLVGLFALVVLVPIVLWLLNRAGLGGALRDVLVLPIPVVGRAVERNLLARWCDLLKLGVGAGMDLPEALRLAGDAVACKAIRRDTEKLIDAMESGRALDEAGPLYLIPASVPASMRLASEHTDLAAMLGDLSAMYEQQAEMRLNTIQVTVAPFLLLALAGLVSLLVIALFLPLVKLMSSVM